MSSSLPHTMFADFENDFKAETIAAEMVEHGTPADRILILMLGAMKRTFRKDVELVEAELSNYDHKEYVLLKTPKEGIYDMLPEGLFHPSSVNKKNATEKEIIKIMKQRRLEEQNARKFFLPFEATINYLRMQMALYENMLDKRSHYSELVDVFKDQWEIFQYLDARQSNIFLHLIPVLHDIRDMHDIIETVMEMIFLLPVKINMRMRLPMHPAAPIMSKMGESGLGINLTTGSKIYEEGIEELLLTIGPVTNAVQHGFMEGNSNEKILNLLCDYLLPVHIDIVTEFLIDDKDKFTKLADKVSDYNSVLGGDTWL